ncbi:MAG: DNA-directed RNA polymerase subunit H [Nanoarchaeota archaeon]|nr:DNA-directed RNA polymerase subunit H [Nanoarchaeota archaeon]
MPKQLIKHMLVPEHVKLKEKEKKSLYEEMRITFGDLPKISVNDAALEHLDVKLGDVIKIKRISVTAGECFFYRGVT